MHVNSPIPAGGVAVDEPNKLRGEIVSNLSLKIDKCETMCIKLFYLDIILGVIYRHPKSNVKLFVDELDQTLEQLKTTKVYLIGDVNINIFLINNAKYAGDYDNELTSNGYFPLITISTHVTHVSSTLIDHLISNDQKDSIFSLVIETDLTGHYPMICSVNTFTFFNKLNQQMFKRDLLNFNAENVCEDLHKSTLNIFHQNNAINPNNFMIIFHDFIKIVITAIDNYAPLKKTFSETKQTKNTNRGLLMEQKLYLSQFINGDTEKINFLQKIC